eukprot:3990128-Amphidinium_carterae.1
MGGKGKYSYKSSGKGAGKGEDYSSKGYGSYGSKGWGNDWPSSKSAWDAAAVENTPQWGSGATGKGRLETRFQFAKASLRAYADDAGSALYGDSDQNAVNPQHPEPGRGRFLRRVIARPQRRP